MMKKNTLTIVIAMLMISAAIKAQSGLFISELADPADEYTGRFVELYNAGSEAVDFDNTVFYLTRQSNGGTSWGTVQLTGSIASGQTYVIGGSAFESHYGFAPDLETGILTGNGDDAYSLYEGGDHENGTLHDIFGVKNEDGTDTDWEYTDSRAIRDDDVDDPRILWSSTEWTITSANIADCNPGTHLGSVSQNPVVPNGSLAVLNDTVEWGELVSVAISTGELSAEDNIISFQFDIDYDGNVLEYSNYSLTGTMSDGGTVALNSSETNKLSISYMSPTSLIGSGPIIFLQFVSLEITETTLDISQAFLNNTPVEQASSGSILIAEVAPPSGKISYSAENSRYGDDLLITATFSEPMSETVPVSLSFSGAVLENNLIMSRTNDTVYTYTYSVPDVGGEVFVSFSNGADLWGNEVLADPTTGTGFNIFAFLAGDVNDDGEVQAFDAALALQYSVSIDPLPEEDPLPWENWRQLTADVDENGNITAYDAGLILQYSAGIISSYPTGKKGVHDVELYVEQEDEYLIIYAEGSLIGINIEMKDESLTLGEAVFLNDSFLSAVKMNGEVSKVGLCMEAFPSGKNEIVRFPIMGMGDINLRMLANCKWLDFNEKIGTSIEAEIPNSILVYPNPAADMIYVDGLNVEAIARLYDMKGMLLLQERLEGSSPMIDVSVLEEGIYILKVQGSFGECTRKVSVRH